MEVIVAMLMNAGNRRHATTVTIYDLCINRNCEEITLVIKESLSLYASKDIPKYFLVLAGGNTIKKIVEQVSLFTTSFIISFIKKDLH